MLLLEMNRGFGGFVGQCHIGFPLSAFKLEDDLLARKLKTFVGVDFHIVESMI